MRTDDFYSLRIVNVNIGRNCKINRKIIGGCLKISNSVRPREYHSWSVEDYLLLLLRGIFVFFFYVIGCRFLSTLCNLSDKLCWTVRMTNGNAKWVEFLKESLMWHNAYLYVRKNGVKIYFWHTKYILYYRIQIWNYRSEIETKWIS